MSKWRTLILYLPILLLLAIVFLFSIHTLMSINQDIGRHLRLGEIIWKTHHIPATNLLSYTATNYPFINHHWLSEVVFYLLSLVIGLSGLIVLKAIIFTAAVALAFFAFFRRETILPACIVGIVSMIILLERTDVRPEIFSYLFLSWFLFVLFNKKQWIWTLPLVQLIWVNSHIYFFLGPMVYACWLSGEIVNHRWDKKYLWWGMAILGVNLINPFGFKGAIYPLLILHHYGYSIVENKSPFFLQPFGYPQLTTDFFFLGSIISALSFAVNWKKIKENIGWLILTVLSIAGGLYMIRNFPILALVMIPVCAQNFYQAGFRVENIKSFVWFEILMLGLIFSIISNQIYAQASLGRKFGLDVPTGAQAAVDFVRVHHLKGPMFNNFDIGSFLIWKLPEEPVFIDGRPEAYPEEFIQNVYIPMQEDPAIWEQKSKEYNIQFVFWNYTDITPWSQSFIGYMVQNPNWPIVYKDGQIVIFARKN